MNVNVQISTNQNETLTKTASEMAESILVAVGGDPQYDTVTVSVAATAGNSPVIAPGIPGGTAPAPPAPRSIG
jgi:hypothetical protein